MLIGRGSLDIQEFKQSLFHADDQIKRALKSDFLVTDLVRQSQLTFVFQSRFFLHEAQINIMRAINEADSIYVFNQGYKK
jgi:hypothetical protein